MKIYNKGNMANVENWYILIRWVKPWYVFNTFSWSILQVGRLEFEAAEWFAHPNWVSALIRNDIGLIRLPQKVEFNEFIRPICLPSYSDVDDNFAGLDVSFF